MASKDKSLRISACHGSRAQHEGRGVYERGEGVNTIEEIKQTIKMEIRPSSEGMEYLEAVVNKKDLDLLYSILTKRLGPAAKESGKEADLPQEIQETVDSLGGVRYDQSFFYKRDIKGIAYAALWPWASNPDKITLKCSVKDLA